MGKPMDVNEIRVKFGLTQNLGDYSNVKLEVELTGHLNEDADQGDFDAYGRIEELLNTARAQVYEAADQALEANGREVVYYQGPLYYVRFSDVRQVVVIYPVGTELPDERNWKERDSWRYYYGGEDGRKMRPELARATFARLCERHPEMAHVSCADGDLSRLPPLPDPGPEPKWHSKRLQGYFEAMYIPEDEWEAIAELEHVTEPFVREVRAKTWGLSAEDYTDILKAGTIPASKTSRMAGYDEESEEDYDEDELTDFDDE